MKRITVAFAAFFLIVAPNAFADTINVVSSGGFAAAYKELIPEFEKRTGNKVVSQWGPSMGTTKNAVPQRLARNEDIDVLIMVGDALDNLIADKKVIADTRMPLAQSGIGIVVKEGAPALTSARPQR